MQSKQHAGPYNTNEQGKAFDRRKFMLYSAGAGAGLLALASGGNQVVRLLTTSSAVTTSVHPSVPDSSRVVVIRNENIFSVGQAPEKNQVGKMLDTSIRNLFDVEDSQMAWRRLFGPDDVVGIKVNCIAGPNLSTHPHVVEAIVAELEKIPIPREKIIIWDRTNRELEAAGYSINADKSGVRCYGTDTVGYEDKASQRGSFNGRLSKILTRQVTALINVPVLKDHGGAGVTIAMKNHYGSFHNPGSHHGNMCDPSIADLNSLDEVKVKTRLVVCDATRATCNGGPGYNPAFAWQYAGLILSCDPVALDTIGTKIIDERRTEVGLPRLAETGRYPRQLASAAERALGNAEMSKIELRALSV
jgi:uncharacterized protein (DUF362 family)